MRVTHRTLSIRVGAHAPCNTRLVGGAWVKDPVELLPDVGQYAAIAADAQGEPSISYYDRAPGDLRYAARRAERVEP